ncbi:hypothetical protein LOTGIDRAFT_223849 [Lottia gigantea]|uniref:WD repeat-containing protein 46 n=1 Tax=Lottia gigantea TaxID=225164 RepID=V4AJV7_LOTGI|nr:hypothetical protein LOTGIDRAFT_223849 [Lottia gigantea]ESP04474.1 hypothetical protein LOTGIDRAFT_223849 [Lottia gigantea]
MDKKKSRKPKSARPKGNVKKKVQYETSAEDKFGTSHKGRRHRFSVSHKYVLPVVDKNSEGGQKVEEYKIDVGKLSRSKLKHQVTKWAGKKKWLKEEGKVNVKSGKSDVRKRLGNKEWRKDKKRKDYQVSRKLEDPYPGDAPVDPVKLEKYKRTDTTELKDARYLAAKPDMTLSKNKTDYAVELSARSDFLLPDNSGCIEVEEGEDTADIKQHDIISSVDITSASKSFELDLQLFGPYNINYSRNGRYLLLGGKKGHVAAVDWQTKKLMCEMNVMETTHDVKWLHIETMFAVAQKEWTYIYDNQGIELHCLKALNKPLRLEFLPYHFLLATGSSEGFLSYLDVSVGKLITSIRTGYPRLDVMCQNPKNAIIHLGHPGGTVTLWSPNMKHSVAKLLCHHGGVRSVAVDNTGNYMATSSIDKQLIIHDLRTYKMLYKYRLPSGAGGLTFSQSGQLAASMGSVVQVYKDVCKEKIRSPYLIHRLTTPISGVQFCNYEDVLGVSHSHGFASLLIPGSGESNFDGFEANPYQTKKQRRQAEVKMLLEKVQPEMITLDNTALSKVDVATMERDLDERKKLRVCIPYCYTPKYRKKGKSSGVRRENRKQGVKNNIIRDDIRDQLKEKRQEKRDKKLANQRGVKSVLDRFKRTVE